MFLDPENMPISAPVEVLFNEYRIPFIIAKTDSDLAFAIGYVQAYMRLEQMTLFRMASQGRLSEIAGPFAVDLDYTLRIINPGKAVQEILDQMPPETRSWVHSYVTGVNAYISRIEKPTPEMEAMRLPLEKWTEKEMVGWWRAGSLDVNLVMILLLLRESQDENWKKIWGDLFPENNQLAFRGGYTGVLDNEGNALGLLGETGSNAIVVGSSKTKQGSSFIASDPHVGLNLPPLWILMGIESPSYHAVGYFMAGTPLMVLGRNKDIAWGGTNMWGISSYLYEFDPDEITEITSRTESIHVRAFFDAERTVRTTPQGPILSDSPYLSHRKDVILRWEGHTPSDEATALLKVMRAKNWQEFHSAFKTYAVPAMNIVYADRQGNIGHIPAIRKPVRKNNSLRYPFSELSNPVVKSIPPTDLPFVYNAKEGYIISTNNNLDHLDPELGWFYPSSSRYRRFTELLNSVPTVELHDLMNWQQDILSFDDRENAALFYHFFLPQTNDAGDRAFLDLIGAWDGRYGADSKAALAYELFLYQLGSRFFLDYYKEESLVAKAMRMGKWKRILFEKIKEKGIAPEMLTEAIADARDGVEEYESWGKFRVQPIRHPLSMVPLIGSTYDFGSLPGFGGSETILKRGGSSTDEPHSSSFGSNARHISDMSDPDENYFVMYGGNDGYLVSPHLTSHMDMWQKGRYIRIPLDLEKIRAEFTTRHMIFPGKN